VLHDYVNLYFNARNPMMFRRVRDGSVTHANLAVLRVRADVLDLPGVVVTGGNAASRYVRFYGVNEGLAAMDYEDVFTRDWRDEDEIQYFRKKSAVCSEVLVPDRVPATHVTGVYRSRRPTPAFAETVALDIAVDPDMFFQ